MEPVLERIMEMCLSHQEPKPQVMPPCISEDTAYMCCCSSSPTVNRVLYRS